MAAYATHCGVHGRTKCFGWPSGFGRKALRGFSGRRDDPLCHCGNTAGVWMIHYANRRRPQGATGTQRPRPAPDPRRAMPRGRWYVRRCVLRLSVACLRVVSSSASAVRCVCPLCPLRRTLPRTRTATTCSCRRFAGRLPRR